MMLTGANKDLHQAHLSKEKYIFDVNHKGLIMVNNNPWPKRFSSNTKVPLLMNEEFCNLQLS